MKQVEICCGSYYDAIQAESGGAKRIELNSALHMGGLTPSVGTLRKIKQETKLKVIAMVRPRGAGFCYGVEDFEIMLEDTKILMENGADGIAFGCLSQEGMLEETQCKQIIDIIHAYHGEAVFHRAFDCVSAYEQTMEALIHLGVDRVLTSGLQANVMKGRDTLKELQQRYGNRIEILAGCGVNAQNAKELMEYTNIEQIHSSCKGWRIDPTTMGKNVSYSYADQAHEQAYEVVDATSVKALINAVFD